MTRFNCKIDDEFTVINSAVLGAVKDVHFVRGHVRCGVDRTAFGVIVCPRDKRVDIREERRVHAIRRSGQTPFCASIRNCVT